MSDLTVLNIEDAKQRLDRVKSGVERIWDDLVALYQGRAWIALGYQSWDALCDAELDGARIALPRQQRREVVADMRQAGMSTRAIASAIGVSRDSVHKDLASPTVRNLTVETITGLDGKSRDASHRRKTVVSDEPWDPIESFDSCDLEVMAHVVQAAPLTEIINQLDQIAREAERFTLPRILGEDGEPLPVARNHISQLEATATRLRETADHIDTYIRRNS